MGSKEGSEQTEVKGRRLREILGVLKKHQVTRGFGPEKLRGILEDLGPTYVKLGQIMSMRSDMLPESYCREFSKLRTDVKPMPFETVMEIVEQELKRPASEVFLSIDPAPLGSASIAQVHRADLKNGEKAVIKVQRPAIREIMADDIVLMRKAAGLLKAAMGTGDTLDFQTIIDELWKTSQEEMDFVKEAEHLRLFHENQKNIQYVICPSVYRQYTTSHLLVMSYIGGVRIDKIQELKALGYDMDEIGRKTAENYCKQILEDGFFHADPHPGNLWISDGKIAWLDLGMAGVLSNHYKSILKKAITAILMNDIYELKSAVLSFGEVKGEINHAALYTDLDDIVSRYMRLDLGSMNLGDLIEDLLNLMRNHKIAVSSDITLLGRSMVTVQGTLSICSPDVSMIQILANHMSAIMLKDFDLKRELRHSLRDIYSSSRKSLEIPAQLSDLLSIAKNGQLRLNTQAPDEHEKQRFAMRLGNRILFGGIAAALFISSSILCLSGVTPQILGMPWPAFLGFTFAECVVLWLIISGVKGRKK